MSAAFRVERLDARHDRSTFDSGSEPLDGYLRTQASQDMRRRVSTCYVLLDDGKAPIAGYYTLAAGSVPLNDLPEALAKKLPRYPSVPVARVGRLAVGLAWRGRKIGSALIADAALRVLRSDMGVFALAVDAKDDAAVAFYRHHGFVGLASAPRQLVLPLASFVRGP